MSMNFVTRTAASAAAVATVAAGMSLASIDQAEAGKKHFWAGVGAGIVTGIVVNEVVRHRRDRHHYYEAPHGSSWDAHVSWCYNRYATYSHHDDRYTAYSGKRRRCNSPYL